MDKYNSIKNDFDKTPNMYQNLDAIPLNTKSMKLKIIFLAEIRERELISKNISKYIASLGCFDK